MDLAIILYTISDDDLRDGFRSQLENQGFVQHPDQSTYTYPLTKEGSIFKIDSFTQWLQRWSKGKDWSETDFISVYYLDKIKNGSSTYMGINNAFFIFE